MGVQGLKTFIEANADKLLTSHELHDTRVILDGNNLCHVLYKTYHFDQKHGGDYDGFAESVKSYFTILKKCNIEPYVLFDGGASTEDRKFETVETRTRERIERCMRIASGDPNEWDSILPLLSKEVLRNILWDLNIKYIKCCFEADEQIVALANKWECPIISNDSDFMVFDVKGGVILLDNFLVGKAIEINGFVPVQIYHAKNLLSHFPKLDKPMLPVFASLSGNDIVDKRELKEFFNVYSKIRLDETILNLLNLNYNTNRHQSFLKLLIWLNNMRPHFPTLGPLITKALSYIPNKDEVRQKISKSMEYYSLTNIHDLSTAFESEWNPYEVHSEFRKLQSFNIPEWFVKQISKDRIGTYILTVLFTRRTHLKCQVEDFAQPSSHACARKIRQIMYSILFKDTENKPTSICEYDRSGYNIQPNEVTMMANVNGITIPSLGQISDMEDTRQFFFHVLGLNPNDEIESDIEIALIAMSFWKQNSELGINNLHLYALLLCIIKLNLELGAVTKSSQILGHDIKESQNVEGSIRRLKEYHEKVDVKERDFEISVVHAFTEFQSIHRALMNFNEFLKCPVKPVCPSQMFNGGFLYSTFCDLRDHHHDPKSHIYEIILARTDEGFADLFDKLLGMLEKLLGFQSVTVESIHSDYPVLNEMCNCKCIMKLSNISSSHRTSFFSGVVHSQKS